MNAPEKLSNNPTARLLLAAFRAFENDLLNILEANGFSDVTIGNFNIIRHLNPEGMRLTALAQDAQISKQAIGKIMKELEYKGYVEYFADYSDGRAKHVRFTKKGEKLVDLAVTAVAEMEKQYQKLLGSEEYNKLRESVMQIYRWHLDRREK